MVSKKTVTYYTPRKRSSRRRSFFYRYTYKNYRAYANRARLNYYKAKINTTFAVFKAQDQAQNWYWSIGNTDFTEPVTTFNFQNIIRDNSELKLYMPVFNELKLTAVSFKCVPNAKNASVTGYPHGVSLVFQETPGATAFYNDPIILSPLATTSRYIRIADRRWLPIAQSAGNINEGRGIPGTIAVRGVAGTQVTQTQSPSWTVYVAYYFTFRKNKNN